MISNEVLKALDSEHVTEALSMLVFNTGPIAHIFRSAGHQPIPRKIEAEQAFVLRWAVKLALQHGADWKRVGEEEIRALQNRPSCGHGE